MNRALEIARHLIHLAADEPEREYLTPPRLQRLLYYAQGWSLALRLEPLFPEPIEAGPDGPFVRAVGAEFKGGQPIAPKNVPAPTALSDDDKAFVASIWESYKGLSANALRAKTRAERPWLASRAEADPDARGGAEIPHRLMADFFADEYRKTQLPGLELEKVQGAKLGSPSGGAKPFEEILREIGLKTHAVA